jgi:energy-coupling factor transporter ATP-binding protein EcfA2
LTELSGFVAYPSQPTEIGQTISSAISHLGSEKRGIELSTWEENDIAGRFIHQPILEKIDDGQILVADVTRLNFNVVFEVGYAIGRQKRAYLIRNSTITGSDELIGLVGIFDTLGYERYSSSRGLASHLASISSVPPLAAAETAPNKIAPVYIVVPRFKADSEIHTLSRVKKARLEFRTFDPEEHGRLPAGEAINNVAQSLGVMTSLLPSHREEAEVHNFRAAFVAGLAMGMDKPLLLLQQGEDPVPLDYRDLVKSFYSLDHISGHIADFSTEVMSRLQAQSPTVVSEPQTFLERLNLGASSAENELRELGNYYLETDEFRRVFKGEVRVVTGRKGAGKTALFVQVRDRLRSDRGKVVLDLKPEGFQLLKFKERVLDYLEEGTKAHTITAFWEYLLLLETCHKILSQDEVWHMRNGHLYEPYRRLANSYNEDDFVAEGDFAERMLKLTRRIAEDFEAGGIHERGKALSSGQVTELLYKHDVGKLRRQVMEYLEFKDSLWILFDNLDKGWPAHGVTEQDVLTLRCLIEALGNIERQLDRRDVEAHGTVFIRNDVYELLVENTSDRGKIPQVGLDWTDGDLLRELLRRRFMYTGVEGEPDFEELWRQVFRVPVVGGEETSQYLIERCLMRPRALIELMGYCRSHAVNLGHEKIELEDIEQGEEDFSVELLYNIGFELQDVFPSAREALYEFLESPIHVSGHKILEASARVVGEGAKEELFNRFLWYGIFGVVREDERVTYIYDARYDMRRLLGLVARRGKEDATFRLNPAFWKALEAQV